MTLTVFNKNGTGSKVLQEVYSWRVDERNNLIITFSDKELTIYAEGAWGVLEVEAD